ncbi:MAG: hypothetical protein AAB289_02410 [Chloroflexota bacterium]
MNLIVVGIDPGEGPEVLRAYASSNGYPWKVAQRNPELLERYRVTSTSTKYVVGKDGIIVYTASYGVGDVNSWRQLFERLAAAG